MIELSPGSASFVRYRAALFIVVFSFFFIAFALAGKAFGGTSLIDALPLGVELIFGCIGVVFALRFARKPQRSKIPIIGLLVAAIAFHFWLLMSYVDFSNCPFGTAYCAAVFYGYLAILVVMVAMLAIATPRHSPPDR